MTRPARNLRLFVAVYPPAELAGALLARLREIQLPRGARMTPIEQVHLTLQFVGDVPVADLDATLESVQRAAAGLPAFRINMLRIIALPERGPCRLIAAETDAPPALLELHTRLVRRLARNPRDRPDRDFRPHMTLCRLQPPAARFSVDPQRVALTGSFDGTEIALMRSTLTNAGATHHALMRVALGQ